MVACASFLGQKMARMDCNLNAWSAANLEVNVGIPVSAYLAKIVSLLVLVVVVVDECPVVAVFIFGSTRGDFLDTVKKTAPYPVNSDPSDRISISYCTRFDDGFCFIIISYYECGCCSVGPSLYYHVLE